MLGVGSDRQNLHDVEVTAVSKIYRKIVNLKNSVVLNFNLQIMFTEYEGVLLL